MTTNEMGQALGNADATLSYLEHFYREGDCTFDLTIFTHLLTLAKVQNNLLHELADRVTRLCEYK